LPRADALSEGGSVAHLARKRRIMDRRQVELRQAREVLEKQAEEEPCTTQNGGQCRIDAGCHATSPGTAMLVLATKARRAGIC
jgi:hypothetical protein